MLLTMPIIKMGLVISNLTLSQKKDVRVLFENTCNFVCTAATLNIKFNFYDTLNLQYVFKKRE